MDVLLTLVGAALLYLGAEALVRGSVDLSLRLGVEPLMVGLTVVAFGTSAPEMAVSVLAALEGHGDISIGNVLGSNSFNIGVILGISALIRPLRVHLKLIRRDMPIMIGAVLVSLPIVLAGRVPRWVGVLFVAGIVAYVMEEARKAREDAAEASAVLALRPPAEYSWPVVIGMIAVGFATLVLGSKAFVAGAVGIARRAGISEAVIGLTLVAAGTSLPELATSAVAALKKQADIAVGNIVGSNIFNILAIVGCAATIAPLALRDVSLTDAIVTLGFSVCILVFSRTGGKLSRLEGVLLFLAYIAYASLRLSS
jgi:cation:H+ antiporter